jgi:DnaJ-class molecular chaperone
MHIRFWAGDGGGKCDRCEGTGGLRWIAPYVLGSERHPPVVFEDSDGSEYVPVGCPCPECEGTGRWIRQPRVFFG